MALSVESGSGEFVPRRFWSCPVHDYPLNEYGEDDPWECPGEVCLDCETGFWHTKRDENGDVIMREVGIFESFLNSAFKANPTLFPRPLLAEKIAWLGDEPSPSIPLVRE